jgi:hypothetical protein
LLSALLVPDLPDDMNDTTDPSERQIGIALKDQTNSDRGILCVGGLGEGARGMVYKNNSDCRQHCPLP